MPNILQTVAKAVGVNIDPIAILDKGAEIAGKFIQTPEEKAQFELEMLKVKNEEQANALQRQLEAQRAAYDDLASARTMYTATGHWVQEVLAIIFTVAFFAFVTFLLFLMKDVDLSEAQQNLIFTLFGAISGIMVTIVGFYFGSSKSSQSKDDFLKVVNLPPQGKTE